MDPENETGDIAEAVADAIAEPVAEALAEVVETQETHAETAALIAEAALEGERGRRIDALEQGQAACLNSILQMEGAISSLPEMMAAETLALMEGMNSRLSALEGGLESLTAAALNSLTPPVSEPMQEVPIQAPEDQTPPAAVEESPAPPKRNRFHLM